MNDALLLLLGCICAGAGGEIFVRGVVKLATWARIAQSIVAATIAAFATSSPELAVSITSATAQQPQLALGDALGSNVVNIALVLGITALIAPINLHSGKYRRDYAIALFTPLLLAVLCRDGMLDKYDAMLLLATFAVWLGAVTSAAHKQRRTLNAIDSGTRLGTTLVLCLVGLACLIIAGKLIVAGASGIALSFGLDEYVIGALLVALGTSAPELATAIIAKLRNHDEIGIGTLLGSNIFNCLFIVPVAALIHPITFDWPLVSITLATGAIAALTIAFPDGGMLKKPHGLVLIAIYLVHITLTA